MGSTFQRSRSLKRWGISRRYQSLEAFKALPIGDGVHTIEMGERKLDLLLRFRGSKTTLVVFHGALSPRQRTIPYLQGETVAATAGCNLISCSDPSLELGAIACAWFLGDSEIGVLKPLLGDLIREILSRWESENTILFGGSGGGYAAVNFATEFPGSVALAMNPRLNLDGKPESTLPDYLKVCHGVDTKTPMRRVKSEFLTANLATVLNAEQNFDLLLLQNKNDQRFLNHQLVPFLQGIRDDRRTYVKLFEGNEGHSPMSREDLGVELGKLRDLIESSQTFASLGYRQGMSS